MVPFAASIFTVNDLGFHRMKFKSTGLKALFQYFQHVLGFRLATAMHQTIIGVATPRCIRVMIFQPFIEYIVQKQITEHGADYAIDTKENFEFERQISFCRSNSLIDMRRKR